MSAQTWGDLWVKQPKTRFYNQRGRAAQTNAKTCAACRQDLPLTEFHRAGVRGHSSQCKACRSTARRKDGEPDYSRLMRGENHYFAKLTADDVRLIQSLLNERDELLARARAISNRALAEKFDVSTSAIEKIACGKNWRVVA